MARDVISVNISKGVTEEIGNIPIRYNSNSLNGIPLPPFAKGPKESTVYELSPFSIKELCLKPPSCPLVLPPVNPQ